MAIRPILRMGHPLLRKRSREITVPEIQSQWFKTLILDMTETMRAALGAGLAAPQIGELVRVCVIEFQDDSPRYPGRGNQALKVFINPVLHLDMTAPVAGYWEGCLSVPGLRGYVERPTRLRLRYLDETGTSQESDADGFLATVLQHEFDHLDGILYVDRIKSSHHLSFQEELTQILAPDQISTKVVDEQIHRRGR